MGTEAYTIKKETERLQKIARDKGLDKLLSEAYHDSIFAYGSWIDDKRNKRYGEWFHTFGFTGFTPSRCNSFTPPNLSSFYFQNRLKIGLGNVRTFY